MVAAALTIALLGISPTQLIARFDGHWEFVRGRHDGRYHGASARSFHQGDVLEIAVEADRFRVFGVTGPTGGRALVLIPKRPDDTIDFYSSRKHAHVLLYTSPPLGAGVHAAAIVVAGTRDRRSRGDYVNIDTVDVPR